MSLREHGQDVEVGDDAALRSPGRSARHPNLQQSMEAEHCGGPSERFFKAQQSVTESRGYLRDETCSRAQCRGGGERGVSLLVLTATARSDFSQKCLWSIRRSHSNGNPVGSGKGRSGSYEWWPQAVSTDGLRKILDSKREAKPLRVFQENQGELHAQRNIRSLMSRLIAARL